MSDLFTNVAHDVETLKKAEALGLATALAENIEANYFKLGGVLAVIKENAWYEGYDSFNTFVSEKFGFESIKSYYLIRIYKDLVGKQIPWAKVGSLGWTKVKELSPLLTAENTDEWVEKAKGLTVRQLQALIKAKPEQAIQAAPVEDVFKFGPFKLKPDQFETAQHAIAKAKGEIGTEYDNVALARVLSLYKNGSTQSSVTHDPKLLDAFFRDLGWNKTLEVFGALWPKITLEVALPADGQYE